MKAPQPAVYERLRDARFFAICVDGVHDLAETGPDQYAAVFETKVAYMKFRFKVTVAVTRAEPPREIVAAIEGTPLGIVGRMTATSVTTLSQVGDETRIDYAVDTTLTGKLGSLGQPVLRSKVREMEKQFTARLARRVRAGRGRGAMTPFELAEPKTLREAVALLDADDPSVRPIAGGTALMLMMKAGVFKPTKLVSLARGEGTELDRQRQWRAEGRRHDAARGAGAIRRGEEACAGDHRRRCGRCPTSACAMSRRSAAALAHADPHMDLPPVLMALGARVVVQGKSGERTIPVDRFVRRLFRDRAERRMS